MPLELHPLTEADVEEWQRIGPLAFNTGMTLKLYPPVRTPESDQKFVDKLRKSLLTEPDCHFLKVVDTDLNRIIACAKWRINPEGRSEEQLESLVPHEEANDPDSPARRDFYSYLGAGRRKWVGLKPFCILHNLLTDPVHQRRGAGAMLIKWGTDRADALKLPSFVESTVVGKPLYEKHGFKTVHEQVFDLAKYGGEGTDSNTAMIREPLG